MLHSSPAASTNGTLRGDYSGRNTLGYLPAVIRAHRNESCRRHRVRVAARTENASWELLLETPLGRAGQPEDCARVAVFIASDDSAFITGMTFMVDGGSVRFA